MMPQEMTGVEFLRRAKDIFPESARMILSGRVDLQMAIDAINDGAISRLLLKPWDDKQLIEQIEKTIRGGRLAIASPRLQTV